MRGAVIGRVRRRDRTCRDDGLPAPVWEEIGFRVRVTLRTEVIRQPIGGRFRRRATQRPSSTERRQPKELNLSTPAHGSRSSFRRSPFLDYGPVSLPVAAGHPYPQSLGLEGNRSHTGRARSERSRGDGRADRDARLADRWMKPPSPPHPPRATLPASIPSQTIAQRTERSHENGPSHTFTIPASPPPSRPFSPLATLAAPPAPATAQVTTPEEQFGYQIGTDYQLVNYQGLTDYWHLLAQQSDRMTVESIGQDLGRARPVDGDHHFARQPAESGPLQGDRAAAGAR